MKYLYRHPIILDGFGNKLQKDETFLSIRGIIRSTKTEDTYADTILILGIIVASNIGNFIIKRV